MASPSRSDAENATSVPSQHTSPALMNQDGRSPNCGSKTNATVPPCRFWMLAVGFATDIILICLSLFLSMIDTSIVSTCLYTIGSEFEAMQSVNWVALAYSLAHLACAATFAQISNIIGRRNALIVANTIFLTFSLACGFSQSINQLVAFRALQGIGGSGTLSSFFVTVARHCNPALIHG
ncbi:hypothetical protein LLEC1_01401 [Akanthomyces lecanii]|uniref:Major facilitator superfamily (MFS) profile domain-containing protein n=1 Tax=Cordyceps confragosa TaxID=2714763 RepID=A0A179IUC8_CORDF|nr:hypothetical protein LLEC1_01401 [Akanthomyces lecanii]